MEAGTPNEVVLRLGQELKRWEQQYAAAHDGCKPTREAIKMEPAIAAKYSEYHRMRGSRSSKLEQTEQDPSSQRSKKRKSNAQVSTPRKRLSNSTSTPSGTHRRHMAKQPSAGSPDEENPISTAFVGPTPQKDGRVLGLFDNLSETATPSRSAKTQELNVRPALDILDANTIASTPTKQTASPSHTQHRGENSGTANRRHTTTKFARTPQSSGKRFLLDSFLTPSKRRRINDSTTPQSRAKLTDSATPAFLQRARGVLPPVPEESSAEGQLTHHEPSLWASSVRAGTKRKSLTRSFSSMIAEIRQAEDDRLDEELDMLREMEADHDDDYAGKSSVRHKENVLVEDSQAAHLLGPDGSHSLSDDDANLKDGLGKDGKPLKIWKKKGQKRQTRRVIMRPARKQKSSLPTDEIRPADESADEEESKDTGYKHGTSVTETQELDDGDGEDYGVDSDSGDELQDPKRSKKKLKKPFSDNNAEANARSSKEHGDGNGDSVVQKTVKKISATAHANFRRLKIRSSKGAKASGKGRFGRGRR